jgi:hypothetical protein
MTSQQKLIFFAVFGLLCAPTSPLVGRAAAWQCAELTEYVEMWDDSDQDPLPDTLGVYARGTADAAGEPCNVTVRTYILAPNNTELASALASGIGQATSTAVAHLDDFVPKMRTREKPKDGRKESITAARGRVVVSLRSRRIIYTPTRRPTTVGSSGVTLETAAPVSQKTPNSQGECARVLPNCMC